MVLTALFPCPFQPATASARPLRGVLNNLPSAVHMPQCRVCHCRHQLLPLQRSAHAQNESRQEALENAEAVGHSFNFPMIKLSAQYRMMIYELYSMSSAHAV